MSVAVSNRFQGGKAFGLLKARQERRLAEINRVSRTTAGQNQPLLPPSLAFPKYISSPCRVASNSRLNLSLNEQMRDRDPGRAGSRMQVVPLLSEDTEEFLCDQKYSDEENLPEKLAAFKEKYMEFDLNNEGEIDLMSLKRMMEKLGVPKTHLEMKKMISEVTGGVSDTISYRDFVNMMLGKRSAVLKLVMMFEGKANESSPKPAGPPPERDIASLP
ncbi:hypothetical protein ACRRTK_024558 [Alexandromys fortis]